MTVKRAKHILGDDWDNGLMFSIDELLEWYGSCAGLQQPEDNGLCSHCQAILTLILYKAANEEKVEAV